MAFQIPLMKNGFDIYTMNNGRNRSIPTDKSNGRSRKSSESASLSTSPGNDSFLSPRRTASCVGHQRNHFSRVNSRTSQHSLMMSNTANYAMKDTTSPPRPKADSSNSLNKLHTRFEKFCKAFKKGPSSDETRS